jgi:acyl-CoA thioester hydrolase
MSTPAHTPRPAAPHRDDFSFWSADLVRFADLDVFGHVNNNAYGVYFEGARHAFFVELKKKVEAEGRMFILAHQAIDFRRELHYPAALQIGVAVTAIGRTSLSIGCGLFRQEDETCIASSTSISVLIDTETRQSLEIPDFMRAVLTPYQVPEKV